VNSPRIPLQSAIGRRLDGGDPQAGQAVTEVLMYAAVIVGVIIVIGAGLQALGVDIVGKISTALGI
jgi:hypothetical protein